jgi:hypothetical protein
MTNDEEMRRIALDHASNFRGLRDCEVVSVSEPSPGRFEVKVKGMLSVPTDSMTPEDRAEVALFVRDPFELLVWISENTVIDDKWLGIDF